MPETVDKNQCRKCKKKGRGRKKYLLQQMSWFGIPSNAQDYLN